MKKLIILFLMVFIVAACSQEDKNIPESIKSKFKSQYPNADEVEWSKEDGDYEVDFEQDDIEMSVNLDSEGKLLETETAIEISQLPEGIDRYVADNFKGYKITGAAKIIKANKEELFEAEVTKGKDKKDLFFDSNGKPEKKDVNEESESEEEEED